MDTEEDMLSPCAIGCIALRELNDCACKQLIKVLRAVCAWVAWQDGQGGHNTDTSATSVAHSHSPAAQVPNGTHQDLATLQPKSNGIGSNTAAAQVLVVQPNAQPKSSDTRAAAKQPLWTGASAVSEIEAAPAPSEDGNNVSVGEELLRSWLQWAKENQATAVTVGVGAAAVLSAVALFASRRRRW